MKEPVLRLALKAALFLIVFGTAAPLRADVLTVCNNGTVSVVVVTAMKNADLARGLGKYYWAITSTALPTGKCKGVYTMLADLKKKYPAPPPPPPPPPPKRNPTLTVTAPAHDGYAIKMDPSLNAVLADREQEKWKSPAFMVSAYDPKWIGQTLVLKGTVSRVEVERDGDPKWVHIYFKESPDAIITGCSPFPDMLRKKFGNDLSILVGKTIEMTGQVEKFCRPNISIRIVDQAQIKLVN